MVLFYNLVAQIICVSQYASLLKERMLDGVEDFVRSVFLLELLE